MSTTVSDPVITWEKLPNDFALPDEPVDKINQPLLALSASATGWQMLLWGTECLQQEQQLRERMAAKLRELGINSEEI